MRKDQSPQPKKKARAISYKVLKGKRACPSLPLKAKKSCPLNLSHQNPNKHQNINLHRQPSQIPDHGLGRSHGAGKAGPCPDRRTVHYGAPLKGHPTRPTG